ncbi:MAG: HD domain-containing phosphohydrolase [Elusimicrobiota bacterium]
MPAEKPQDGRRILTELKKNWPDVLVKNYELAFMLSTLAVIAFIFVFFNEKPVYLSALFIPVLLAGFFISTRAAVTGAIFCAGWVVFSTIVDPAPFSRGTAGGWAYLHIVLWGFFLAAAGALVGRSGDRLRSRYEKAEEQLAREKELRKAIIANKDRAESILHATIDPYVAKLIMDRKLRNEKRPLSVLFADLVDFTRSAKARPPEMVVEDLNQLFSALEPILARFKGHLDKYLGDGLLAEFGMPIATQNHALLSVLAALRMQKRLREKRFPQKMRIGIATGTSIVGLVGSKMRKNYTAIGDTVNLAARLQAVSPEGGVCIDQRTYEQVRRWFNVRRIRSGLTPEEVRRFEARLVTLKNSIAEEPTSQLCLEAANVCAKLGDMTQTLSYHRRALELNPSERHNIEEALASAFLEGKDRDLITINSTMSGTKERVPAFEVLSLKDTLADTGRLPAKVVEIYRQLSTEVKLPEELVLSVEALEGAIGHGKATAALSGALANAMGLDAEQVRTAFLTGYLHDVGRRNVPEHLLSFENHLQELPPPDQALIKAHVMEAEKILDEQNFPISPEVKEAIRHHHERVDGSGYPDGLKGKDINPVARIVQIADTYEELTSWRPYQEPRTPHAALAEIQRDIHEGMFDPRVGDLFLWIMAGVRREKD